MKALVHTFGQKGRETSGKGVCALPIIAEVLTNFPQAIVFISGTIAHFLTCDKSRRGRPAQLTHTQPTQTLGRRKLTVWPLLSWNAANAAVVCYRMRMVHLHSLRS